jgi:hypothetical protein
VTPDSKVARERMAANPFAPDPNIASEHQQQHALNYIAFYLGEIEQHLAKIAGAAEATKATGSNMALTLKAISERIIGRGDLGNPVPPFPG